uniref:Fas-associated factor 1 n=1 Tax=Sinonovacula constricta TaxID=98310 RepID=A0AAU7YR01_SINCO
MASGEREQVLADFQACTSLDDIETCIAILDQHDWNLLQAVQSVMSQADSPTVHIPPSGPHSPKPMSEEFFSSGFLSDPVPLRPDFTTIDSAAGFDPGSASGPGLGTSSGTGFGSRGNKRLLHFTVEYRNRNIEIYLDDTETVAQIKDTLSTQLAIDTSCMQLKGWSNRKVHDNSLLRDLHLPKENTLFLLTPDLHLSDPAAGPSSQIDNNRTCELQITCKEGSKYRTMNLKFKGTKRVEEVKQDVFTVSDIQVRDQVWAGWPEGTTDKKTLGSIGLSYPIHCLELTRSNLSSRPRTAEEVAMEIEMSEDEEEDTFHIDYDESELFSQDDQIPSSRKQQSLIDQNVRDEQEALEQFTRVFRERYGETHPVFYVGPLDNALRDALLCPAKERKLLAIYLHHDSSILSNVFCSQILCNEGIVNYMTTNFLTWAWDMTLDVNAARLISMATRHFGSVAANQIRGFKPDHLPVLLVISRSRATNEVMDVVRGDVTVDELMSKLISSHEMFSQQQSRDIVEEAEREAREMIRNEQDQAYQLSLLADKKKMEAKQEEERLQRMLEEKEQQKREEEEKHRQWEEAKKQAIQESLAQKVPDEPPEGCTEVTCTLRIRTPAREMLVRKFYGQNKLRVLKNYIISKGFHLTDYKLLTTFPRRDLSNEDDSQSLEELKLCPQETLILEERT